ncbi:MAG TPA: hypothetical protein VFZ65_00895, partial [Planctomycetota bacterium]|nr:hypothetical protein [Planctomycetota bacterium]
MALTAAPRHLDEEIPAKRARRLARAVWVLTATSVLLLFASMLSYSGGSAVRPDEPGFDLWHNYFCDLIRPIGHGGRSNTVGMHLGQAGMLAAASAFLPLWLVLPRLFPAARAARVCRWAGVLAAITLPG